MKVTVVTRPGNRVSINNQQRTTVRSVGIASTAAATSLGQLSDIDISDAENNEVLVYDEAVGKYVIKPIPIVDGGTF